MWDSNPRYREVQLISSQSRYDHFDIAPCLFPPAILVVPKALKNPLERKAGENTEKYSIFDFENPYISRFSGGRNDQVAVKFRVSPVMTTSITLRVYFNPLLTQKFFGEKSRREHQKIFDF